MSCSIMACWSGSSASNKANSLTSIFKLLGSKEGISAHALSRRISRAWILARTSNLNPDSGDSIVSVVMSFWLANSGKEVNQLKHLSEFKGRFP